MAYSRSIYQAQSLYITSIGTCNSYGKLEKASQVETRTNHLLWIAMRDCELVRPYEYLKKMEEMCDQQKNEIQ